jgi:hypothetical protein
MSSCPHCSHPWAGHGLEGVPYAPPCHCGCLWRQPTPDKPPPEPLTPRQELLAVLCDTLWSAFEAQDNVYVDRGMDMIDASGWGVDMDDVAEAVLSKLESLGVLEENDREA